MILEGYRTLGGLHPETNALKNALAYQGVVAPHTGRSFSEAMLLGIGGGLGMGYQLRKAADQEGADLVVGFRKNWDRPLRFIRDLCERLSIPLAVRETGSQEGGAGDLRAALLAGKPALVWVDVAGLPYYSLGEDRSRAQGHVVGVFGYDEGARIVHIDDRARAPFQVSADALAAARARVPSLQNRLVTVSQPGAFDLEKALTAGIHDCVSHLQDPSNALSLPAIREWAERLRDSDSEVGWRQVFVDGRGLYTTLRSLVEGVTHLGFSGGSLRDLYADFCSEARAATGRPALRSVATRYRVLAHMWLGLADVALPAGAVRLNQTRALLAKRHDLMMSRGMGALDDVREIGETLEQLRPELDRRFPLGPEQLGDLYTELGTRLLTIYDAEREAIDALDAAIA